jgi:nitroreductase
MDQVPEEKLMMLVQAASAAASAGNKQPWTFITVCNAKRIKALRAVSPGMLSNPTAVVVLCIDETLALHTEDGQINKMAWMDLGAAMQNMLLAAHELGLGACPIGSFNVEAVTKMLSLPSRLKPALFVAVGIPERIPEKPMKRPLEEISFVEKYGEFHG